MKILLKIITVLILAFSTFWTQNVNAEINIDWVSWTENITNHSIKNIVSTWNLSDDAKKLWFSSLTIIKYIVSWLLVIYLVYIGIQMILSMWSNEEELSASKKQLRYTLIWLVFINIPGSLYQIFDKNTTSVSWNINNTWSNEGTNSILINNNVFEYIINWWVVVFIEIALSAIAIIIIIIEGIRIMASRWRDEELTEAKNKVVWSLIWLMFIWFIEAWKRVIYTGDISWGANLFKTAEQLALFFAGPVAIGFLTLAWYYFITADGDEERVKKAKSIVVNTVIATIILLASHAFLKDLITLNV